MGCGPTGCGDVEEFRGNGVVPAVRLGLANSAEPSVDHSTKPETEGSRRSAVVSLITEGEVHMMSGTKPIKGSVSSLRSIVMHGLGRWRPAGA